jgi:putative DNA primase/helicase
VIGDFDAIETYRDGLSEVDALTKPLEVEVLDTGSIAENLDLTIEVFELKALLDSVEKADFFAYFAKHGIEEPKQKHYLVAIVEYLQDTAKAQKWDLVRQDDFIYFYNGKYWQNIPRDTLKRFLYQFGIKSGYSEIEAKHHKFIDELYKQFVVLTHLETPIKSDNQVLINLQNGTFEMGDTIKLREHRKEDFLTYILPFDYVPNATASKFETYISEVLPDIESKNVLQEFCGYIFTKNLKFEKCMVLYGSGANGKSVFVDIINALLGRQNITNYSLANLNIEHNRAMIRDALVNWGYEINGKVESDTFKNLISNEPIQARLLYGNSFMMSGYAKLAFNANSLPKEVEHNEAYFRRFLIIPFDTTVPTDKRNPNLAKEIINDELSGIFSWIVEGLKRLLAQGNFSECQKAKDALDTYKKESDSVEMFIDDKNYHPDKTQSYKKPVKSAFVEYREFAHDNGFRPLNINNFSKRLVALGFWNYRNGSERGFYIR